MIGLYIFLSVIVMISVTLGAAIITESDGAEFLNPIWLHSSFRLNWFGVFVIAILLNLGTPIVAFCYWFYKACTAGR